MKKLFIITLFAMLITSCGVGTYSVSSGKPDDGYVCVTDDIKQDIVVKIDYKEYNIETVKTKAYKSGRDIKKTALNSVRVQAGQHQVDVMVNGKVVLSRKVLISTGETKILEL